MTPLEQAALICLHYSMYCTLEKMPLWVVGEWALGQEFNPEIKLETADTYHAALEGMLAKGWLRVVDKTPEERLAKLRAAGWIGPNPHWIPQKGDLDFTRKGYTLYRRICRANGTAHPESLLFVEESKRVVQIVASTKAQCLRAFQESMGSSPGRYGDELASYVGKPVRVLRVEEPERVGRWMEREMSPHRGGWRIQVHYQPIRRCRVEIPELGVTGWRETMHRTTITGRVRPEGAKKSLHFELSEPVDCDSRKTVSYRPRLIVYDGKNTPKPILTVYHGDSVSAGGIGDGFTHFQWHGSTALPQPMTPELAVAALREGILAWQSHRSGG
ncbi:hypothetical protein [Armatimonas rosea]|uniref:Uncharacterized protein n=1 Tax=Armatimonas rosea TaxID=685828 RepID=A0A7W9W876_ARMRO|nr:hypothetical protein [Armatimonas rosea]MBB6053224.1 hypothetical protein [Armatimonas rosea]